MHRKALVGRRARDGSRYKGEGRESGRGSPLWRLIMQSLATRAIEDKMLSHIRPSGKVSRSWDLAVPSQLVKQRPFLPGQERPTAANCAPCSKSKLVSRPDTTKDVYTEQKEKEERRGGGLGSPVHGGGGRWLGKVSRIGHRRDTLTTLVERIGIALTSIYTVTPLLLFFFSFSLSDSLLFFHLFFPPDPAHFILLHHPRRPSVIRVSLIFSDRFFWAACSLFFGQLSAPSRDLIDDRFDYLRPAQSISFAHLGGVLRGVAFRLAASLSSSCLHNLADPTWGIKFFIS